MVRVYYQTNEARRRNPLTIKAPEKGLDKDDYELVHTYETKDAKSLEEIFREMNAVEGNELCVQLKVRSMSAGDVVVDEDDKVWFCAFVGWQQTSW